MAAPETNTVDQLILSHLDQASLPNAASNLLFGALLGAEDFAQVLGGGVPTKPPNIADAAEAGEPIGTYLASIEVTGFRGIGPTTTLPLTPGPGLIVVTGRNGSGKSSFAEAAEFALTGDNKRWSGRTSIWQDGWRNLHATGDVTIRVRLGVDGNRNGAVVDCRWAPGAKLGDCISFLQVTGQPRQSVQDLGWRTPLELYRPFLSYAELGGLLGGKPSEMHDSLQRILGLGRLVEIETMLKVARKEMDDQRTLAAEALPALREALAAHPDPRARQAEQALAGGSPDLDRLDLLATLDTAAEVVTTPLRQLDLLTLPDRAAVISEIANLRRALGIINASVGTPAEEARTIAGLLRVALRHQQDHPDQPCPVCGGRTLNGAWAEQAGTELAQLTDRAEQLDQAHRDERGTRDRLRELVPIVPPPLRVDLAGEGVDTAAARSAWQRWDELLNAGQANTIVENGEAVFDTLVAAVEPVQDAARKVLAVRQQAWQPVADQIRAWVQTAQTSERAARNYAAMQQAITWLRKVGEQIRNEKLAPVAAKATEIWNTLRQESSVNLDGIRLAGTGPSRRVDLDVYIEGAPGKALGVMSQGELHSLALALFLPRATMPESPFRFLVIDDPVQSMDPAKVYGLARVLDEVAKHRQVIVFTHDDRLPAAVRQLQLKARIVIVSRLPGSRVPVHEDEDGNPAKRYLADAWAVARDDEVAPKVRAMIACVLIREAITYTCHELIRRRDFHVGVPIADTERAITDAPRLRSILALALEGDAMHDVSEHALQRVHPAAPRIVKLANRGAHTGDVVGSLTALVEDASRVVERLGQS